MRGRMNDVKSYVPPVQIGEVMVGQTVGEVIDVARSEFRARRQGADAARLAALRCRQRRRGSGRSTSGARRLPTTSGVLGMPGITAWFGLFEIGQPKAGDTLVVSAASGAVGSVVGQLAKIIGCRVVGIAGGTAEVRLRRAASSASMRALDYKAGSLLDGAARRLSVGVDVYFENVGGEMLDTLLRVMNVHSRIVVCGLIAEYNATEPYRYRNLRSVLVNADQDAGDDRVRLEGPLRRSDRRRLPRYLAEAKLKYRESVVHGIDNAPKGLDRAPQRRELRQAARQARLMAATGIRTRPGSSVLICGNERQQRQHADLRPEERPQLADHLRQRHPRDDRR